MRFVDSHLHLEATDATSLLTLPSNNLTLLFVCGIDRKTSEAALRLAEASPGVVKAFVGVHPSEVLTELSLDWLAEALERAAGVGEIGLDPKYSAAGPGTAQMKAFLAQLEAARGQRKPIQVHSRDAERHCLDALAGFTLKSVVMHWFQDENALLDVLEKGYFVSFGPALLYSKKLQRMAAMCDPCQVLAETDSPIAYGPLRGAHGPFLIPSVVFKLAELWGIQFEEARVTIAKNNSHYLGLPEKG